MPTTATQPRMIPAGYVREGDELATYSTNGMLAGGEKGVRDADWRGEITWLHIGGPHSTEKGGIPTTTNQVIPIRSDEHVVVRELVSTDYS